MGLQCLRSEASALAATTEPTPDGLPTLMELEDVARQLHISRSTLYDQVLPQIRTVRVGRRRLVYWDDVVAWLEAKTQGPGVAGAVDGPAPRRQGRPRGRGPRQSQG